MENLFSGILSSIKYYFKAIRLFWKGEIGIYFLLFRDNVEFSEIKKYTLLLLSFFFFYVIGLTIGTADFILGYQVVSKSYNLFVSNLLTNNNYKDNFKLLLSIVLILEFLAFIFAKKKDRALLSRYNFLLASWTFSFMSFLVIIASIFGSVLHWLNASENVRDITIGLVVIVSFIFVLGLFISPWLALSKAKKRGVISEGLEGSGALLNILIPVIIFFLLKGVFKTPEIQNKVYFLNGDKSTLNLQLKQLDQFKYSIQTTFIIENDHTENYILKPGENNYFIFWNIVDANEKTDTAYSDTIMLRSLDANQVNIAPKTPQKINLTGYITAHEYYKLKYLKNSTVEKLIHLSIKTVNLENIQLAYVPLTIKEISFLDSLKTIKK